MVAFLPSVWWEAFNRWLKNCSQLKVLLSNESNNTAGYHQLTLGLPIWVKMTFSREPFFFQNTLLLHFFLSFSPLKNLICSHKTSQISRKEKFKKRHHLMCITRKMAYLAILKKNQAVFQKKTYLYFQKTLFLDVLKFSSSVVFYGKFATIS